MRTVLGHQQPAYKHHRTGLQLGGKWSAPRHSRRTMPDRENDGTEVEVIWGTMGQNCTTLPLNDVEGAEARGDLVLLH